MPTTSPAQGLTGSRLGQRYRVFEEIGTGGMATVYRALDERLGREVALKVLLEPSGTASELAQRAEEEAHAVAKLAHPHVVPVYDFGIHAGRPYLVLQLVKGPSLAQFLERQGALDRAAALRIGAQLASALECAHGAGIVHRDVKASNILVDDSDPHEPRVLLADFGIALDRWETHPAPDRGQGYGSVHYVAPEQVNPALGEIGPAADVYALGVVLFEMLAGRRPCTARSGTEVMREKLNGPNPVETLPPHLDQALRALIGRCLEREPARRFPDGRAVREALESLMSDETLRLPVTQPISARPRAPRYRPTSSGRGFRGWQLMALPVAALVVIGTIGLWLGGRPVGSILGAAVVPAVAGLPLEDARSRLEADGFTAQARHEPTLDTPAGVVVTQEPLAGESSKSGTEVQLLVSAGIQVPHLVDLPCGDARVAVSAEGWSVRPVRWRFANVQDFGKVVHQEPAAGAVVPQKGEIQVQVAGPVGPC